MYKQKLEEPKDVFFTFTFQGGMYNKPSFNLFQSKESAESAINFWKDKEKSKHETFFYSEKVGQGAWNKPETFIKKLTVREILDRTTWLNMPLDQEILIVNI